MEATVKYDLRMNIGNFAGDYGGVGLVGSFIMLMMPMTDISAFTTIFIGVATLVGQGLAWYYKRQDRKDRKRRFNSIADILESQLRKKIESDSVTIQDTETFMKVMEKLDDIDKD